MAESYAKHLDRLEHSRHAEREATGPNYAVLPPSPPSESTATPMSIMPGEDRASVATGGAQQGSKHRGPADVLSMAEARITALVCARYT
jgi:hypothetical protein